MANKTNCVINGHEYYRIQRVVGHEMLPNGQRKSISRTFWGKNKKDAEKKYQEYLKKQSEEFDSKDQIFGTLADKWIQGFFLPDKSLKQRTKELYMLNWNTYMVDSPLYKMSLDKVKTSVVQKTYNTLKCPASAVKTIHNVMVRFYRYLEQEGLARNLTASLVLPKDEKATEGETKEIEVWSNGELRTILTNFDKADKKFRLKFLIILAARTGCRISELLALTYDDFKDDKIIINKQLAMSQVYNGQRKETIFSIDTLKSKASRRIIPMTAELKEQLEIHRKWQKQDMKKNNYQTKYVFTTDTGNFYDRRNILRACERYYKKIGVPYKKFHVYRHTFGTMLCDSGVPIQVASNLLGHSDISITAKYYVNIGLEQKQDAIALLSKNFSL